METSEIFFTNINSATIENIDYRKVLYTVPKSMQLVVMNIPPNDFIDREKHPNTTQFIRVESGEGIVEITYGDEIKTYKLKDDFAIIIPYGIEHKIINTGKTNLKIYTIYTPPEHSPDKLEKFHS